MDRNGLIKVQLKNGLTVIVKEAHAAPVTSFWLWYRVGSRNEHVGITGISHWVEHLQFKGTPRWPAGVADDAIGREGGIRNAYTWFDFTTYFATMPAGRIEVQLDIEADRLKNSSFDPQEVALERTVVISEREGAENDPEFLLSEELFGAAFRVHPYGHQTIGHMCDLKTMTREDLYNHYRTYYAPNNACAVAVGDFEAPAMLALIEKYFGDVPPGPPLPPFTAVEPPQIGERRVVVEGEGTTSYLEVAFHAPRALDPDFYALAMLNAILCGASSMSVMSAGGTNKSSRLYGALVEAGLAADVSGGLYPAVDPYLYEVSATALTGHTAAEMEAVLWQELQRLADEPVTADELTKASKQARAQFAYSSESVTGQAFWIGWSEIFANTTWYERYLDNLAAVTAEDVQRVAQTYLRRSQATVGHYVPKTAGGEAA